MDGTSRVRAQELEFKTVNQMYDPPPLIVMSPAPATNLRAIYRWDKQLGRILVEKLDQGRYEDVHEEYIFVERRRHSNLLGIGHTS